MPAQKRISDFFAKIPVGSSDSPVGSLSSSQSGNAKVDTSPLAVPSSKKRKSNPRPSVSNGSRSGRSTPLTSNTPIGSLSSSQSGNVKVDTSPLAIPSSVSDGGHSGRSTPLKVMSESILNIQRTQTHASALKHSDTTTNSVSRFNAPAYGTQASKSTLKSERVISDSENESDEGNNVSPDGTTGSPMSAEATFVDEPDLGEHQEIESDAEGDSIDMINVLIDDDEYIPFEDGEEDDDEVILCSEAAQSETHVEGESSEPPHKKQRIVSAEFDATEWVKEYDESHHVDADDVDVQRFDTNFAHIIQSLCAWAVENAKSNWHKLSRTGREMPMSFYILFQRASADPAGLVRICLQGMPRETRKILGKADLTSKDLLDLPLVPPRCKHRLVYMDIATQLHESQIHRKRRYFGHHTKMYKAANSSSDVRRALKTKLYVGSSVAKVGGFARIQTHEAIANGCQKAPSSWHYAEISKPDVLCNFRLLGVWNNPYVDDTHDGQDVSRWIAPMVEGLMMVYLGLYTIKNTLASRNELFTASSYRLTDHIRNGLFLPDFSNVSLNRAWSIAQGTPSSIREMCANPECRRPKDISERTLVGTKTTKAFGYLDSGNLLAPSYCRGCCIKYRSHGELRTREGLPTGRWPHENDFEWINQAWIDEHERKCHNVQCGVPIHSAARLYGVENGIRCYRCHEFALSNRKEYSPLQSNTDDQAGDCQVCSKQDVRLFIWNKVRKGEDDDLPSELCGSCYSIRCSFLQDVVPTNAQPKTLAECGNSACWDSKRREYAERGFTKLIENIDEHIWRCIRCDYCHEIGIDEFEKLESLPKPPSGPIASHRFNDTKCIDCVRYISYMDWEKVDGGYRCASCVGIKCCDCDIEPALSAMRKCYDDQIRCFNCYEAHRKRRGRVRRHERVPVFKIPVSRQCHNPICGKTGIDRGEHWMSNPLDKSQFRCFRCHQYFVRRGTEWAPFSKCYNDDCDASGPDVKQMTGPDGNVRCDACHIVFQMLGAERICKGRCHNFGNCGHDHTNWTKGFNRDVWGDDNVRCTQCHQYWTMMGRQFDRDPAPPRPTRQEVRARVCSRPGCHANHQTKGGKWKKWREFLPDGHVCEPCFKVLIALQREQIKTKMAAGNRQEDPVAPDNGTARGDAPADAPDPVTFGDEPPSGVSP
ncbi:hypothetical protein ACHAQJ_006852 [Trichoderma viride]